MNDLQIKLANKLNTLLDKYELLILLIILFPMGLKLLKISFPGIIVILLFGTISTAYFFSGFSVSTDNDKKALDIFVHKITAWASSITLIGILYVFQKWPYGGLLILIGSASLGISLISLILKKVLTTESKIYSRFLLLRVIVLFIVAIYYSLFLV
jgi:hypothetical protein